MTSDELIERLQEIDKGQHLEVELLYENEDTYDTFTSPLELVDLSYQPKSTEKLDMNAKVTILLRGSGWKRLI